MLIKKQISKYFFHSSNGNAKIDKVDITMKEAVDYLASDEETYQHCGASYIQHNTFIDDKAKEEVAYLILNMFLICSYVFILSCCGVGMLIISS